MNSVNYTSIKKAQTTEISVIRLLQLCYLWEASNTFKRCHYISLHFLQNENFFSLIIMMLVNFPQKILKKQSLTITCPLPPSTHRGEKGHVFLLDLDTQEHNFSQMSQMTLYIILLPPSQFTALWPSPRDKKGPPYMFFKQMHSILWVCLNVTNP